MSQPERTHEHPRFDRLVAEIEEYEPLPEVLPVARRSLSSTEHERMDVIDEEILAGLVSP